MVRGLAALGCAEWPYHLIWFGLDLDLGLVPLKPLGVLGRAQSR